MAKSKKSPKSDNNLEAWVQQKTQEHAQGRARCDDWPDKVVDEIKFVLKCNDEGKSKITIKDMMGRLRDVHGIESTSHDFRHFACQVLKRHSWSKKS